MGYLDYIMMGFKISLQLENILFCFIGVFLGNLVGVLPGIGPLTTISLLLPMTFHFSPVTAVIMLAGIYYGCMYGGTITSILVNIPGEPASIVTCLDGYQMALKGRAGPALGIAAFGSFIAGTLSLFGLMFLVVPLSSVALRFQAPEYSALILMGFSLLIYMASGSKLKAGISILIGVILSCGGIDIISGKTRFDYGLMVLKDGVGIIPLAIGLFGVSEILVNLEESKSYTVIKTNIRSLLPSFKDWVVSKWAILRGTLIGFLLGIIPGGGAIVSSFVSYTIEKRFSKYPERFGTGVIEGVAGPESANNSACSGALIPLFALGIPPNSVIALLMGALIIHGITPGPLTMKEHPEIFWGTVASMYIGNVMLLILNIPLIAIWVRILKVPYYILFPLILLFCLIGTYSINNQTDELIVMIIFGVVGYLMRKFDFEVAPLILAFVLGPIFENSFRQSLVISDGSLSIFFTRAISGVLMVVAFFLLLSSLLSALKKQRTILTK